MGKRVLDNISFKINLEKRNFPQKDLRVVGNFSEYIGKPGVWACWGLKKGVSDNEWVCLNVGESDDIGTEMRVSRRYSKGQFKHRSGVYRNYRGEVVFTFVKPKNEPINTRERVWHNIGKNYNSLYFVIVSESSNRDERLRKEDEYARDNGALYWNPSPKQKKL